MVFLVSFDIQSLRKSNCFEEKNEFSGIFTVTSEFVVHVH